MSKYFVKTPKGRMYTPLKSTSGEVLSMATCKFIKQPYRRRAFKDARKVWESMKEAGFTVEEVFSGK